MIDFHVRKTSSRLRSVTITRPSSSKRAELRLLAQVDLCAELEGSIEHIRSASASSKLSVYQFLSQHKSSRFFSSCVHPRPTFVHMHMWSKCMKKMILWSDVISSLHWSQQLFYEQHQLQKQGGLLNTPNIYIHGIELFLVHRFYIFKLMPTFPMTTIKVMTFVLLCSHTLLKIS